MTAEREPAPRRVATYPGDQRHLLDQGWAAIVGPDNRGIAWLPTHVEYHAAAGKSRVVFRPVSEHEIRNVLNNSEEKKQ